MMTGKTIALIRQTSVDKVMSLLFKILSNFVITFLPLKMFIKCQLKQCQTLFWGAPKSLEMVTAAMKLKDAYSLEGKL